MQLAGHKFQRFAEPRWHPTARDTDVFPLLARFERICALYRDAERLAQHRAQQLRATETCDPLRLLTAFASTSPAFAGETNRGRTHSSRIAALISCLPHLQRKWGRWRAASWLRDGGGLTVSAGLRVRAPPWPAPHSQLPIPSEASF